MTAYKNYAYKHGVGWSIWHLEWVTKYRRRVFEDEELQKLCAIAFEEAAKRYNFKLDEFEIQPEHVHLIVQLRPSMSPSKAVMLLKGYSGRLLFLLAENKLRKFYWLPKGKTELVGRWKIHRICRPHHAGESQGVHQKPKGSSCQEFKESPAL